MSRTAAPPRRIWIPFDATVCTKGAPAPMATDPMNTDRPRFRSTRFATTGILQPIGPVRPSQPRTSAMTSGPPATPRLNVPPPGKGTGIMPSTSPSAIPTPIETKDISALPLMLSPKMRGPRPAGRRELRPPGDRRTRSSGRTTPSVRGHPGGRAKSRRENRAERCPEAACRRRPPSRRTRARHRNWRGHGSGAPAPHVPWRLGLLDARWTADQQQPVALLQSCLGDGRRIHVVLTNRDDLDVGRQRRGELPDRPVPAFGFEGQLRNPHVLRTAD